MNPRETEQADDLEIEDLDTEYELDDEKLSMQASNLTNRQIERIFDQGRFRLHQDRNDFTLP